MSEARKIKVTSGEEEEAGLQPTVSSDQVPAAGDSANDVLSGEGESPDDAGGLQSKLASTEKECKDTYDRLLRVTAEFENYKKRMAREMEDFRKFANQSLLKEMLSVVDHIELAIQAAGCPPSQETSLIEGLNLTLREFLRILEKFKVKPIEAVGQPFDPNWHEAIGREPREGTLDGEVLHVRQTGYRLHDRVVRPAYVVVSGPGPT
jgi:molecular chaperone GrpE